VLDTVYNVVKKRQPSYTEVFLASGELALEKNDYALAAEAFGQAAKLDVGDADAHFGLARAFAPSDAEKAEAAIKTALKWNPNHTKSLLLIAEEHIDAERYDEAEEVLGQVMKINPHQPRALALKAVIAHLKNQPDSERFQRLAALRYWPTNPEVDFLIGKKLSQKYRFAEGEKYQRQALEFDPKYVPAKMQLAQDLLRLGKEEEGWRLADEALSADGYNVVAHNLVTLQENIAKFRTFEEDGFLLRMDAREADIYGRRVLDLLKRARRELCAKYDVQLDQPVIVELFPRQQDFAIRTFGLPGGAGFLGGRKPHLLGGDALSRVLPRGDAQQDEQQDAAVVERGHLGLRRAASRQDVGPDRHTQVPRDVARRRLRSHQQAQRRFFESAFAAALAIRLLRIVAGGRVSDRKVWPGNAQARARRSGREHADQRVAGPLRRLARRARRRFC
jgi:tetratricopeptide (TPR) repeat protein